MRTKDERLHERRKAEILKAAAACFADKGIRQTTMQEICAAAQISPGALYRYFESTSALRRALPEIVEELARPSVARLSLEIIAEAARNEDICRPFLECEAIFKDQLIELLKNGQSEGFVNGALDVEAFVHLFTNLLDSICVSYAFPVKVSKKSLVKTIDQFVSASLRPDARSR
ncbi:MAG: helix-turn-helix domain containing protein [Novosphingobium sp.]